MRLCLSSITIQNIHSPLAYNMTSVLPNAYKSVKKAATSQNASITTWAVMFIRLVEELITRLESLPPKASFLWIKLDNPLLCDNIMPKSNQRRGLKNNSFGDEAHTVE